MVEKKLKRMGPHICPKKSKTCLSTEEINCRVQIVRRNPRLEHRQHFRPILMMIDSLIEAVVKSVTSSLDLRKRLRPVSSLWQHHSKGHGRYFVTAFLGRNERWPEAKTKGNYYSHRRKEETKRNDRQRKGRRMMMGVERINCRSNSRWRSYYRNIKKTSPGKEKSCERSR